MADADALLRAGDLAGARAALVEQVRAQPADQTARMFFFQLLCLLGEWERARTHLRALAQMSPEAQMLAVTYNMALDAEGARAQVFAGAAPPVLLAGSSPWSQDLVRALGAAARGETAAAEEFRAKALDAAPDTPGTLDDSAFDWIADADLRFGPSLEAIFQGQWGLIPFEAIESIVSPGPRDLRDAVWLPAQIRFKSGQSGNALLPTRYPGTELQEDASLRLARATAFVNGPAGEAGIGEHEWGLSDGSSVGLLSLRRLAFT